MADNGIGMSRAEVIGHVGNVLAAVIKSEPEWSALPRQHPPASEHLIRRCLQKDVRQRLQAIGDARIAIEETLGGDVGAGLVPARTETVQGGHKGRPYDEFCRGPPACWRAR